MVAALESSEIDLHHMQLQQSYRDQFENYLSLKMPGISFVGKNATRAPNTTFLIMPMHENLRWVRKLDVLGFQVSTGSACATGKSGSSEVLNALGYPSDSGWMELAQAFVSVAAELCSKNSSGGTNVISI
jgi:cysteine desulfurase